MNHNDPTPTDPMEALRSALSWHLERVEPAEALRILAAALADAQEVHTYQTNHSRA